jgi:hypothetical protein
MRAGKETQASQNPRNLLNKPKNLLALEGLLLTLKFSKSKAVRGALVCLSSNLETSIINSNSLIFVFQYNPEMLTHTFSSPSIDEALKKKEKPTNTSKIFELISLNLELDAADQTEQPNKHSDVVNDGLHPAFATLESIILSQSKNEKTDSSFVLFIWGPNRIIPVTLENVRILEENFDRYLNPIRAKIELVMRVLDLSEFRKGSLGYKLCLSQLDRRKLFTRKLVEEKIYRDFFKQIFNNVAEVEKKRKTKEKSS